MPPQHDILNYPMVVASISLPWWLPSVETVSQFAALMVPVFVCVYWALMIALKLYDRRKAKHP